MIGLASSLRHMASISARAASGSAPSVDLEVELDELAHAHAGDAVEAEGRQGPFDGHALGIEDPFLGGDVDADVHRLAHVVTLPDGGDEVHAEGAFWRPFDSSG